MVTWEEFKKAAANIDGYILASLTDEYIVDTWPEMSCSAIEGKEHKLLEVRIFNKEQEMKLFRTDISKEFCMRCIDDNNRDYIDSEQYLDIDEKKSSTSFKDGKMVYATGGGKFHLPLNSMKNAKAIIRYYLDKYEETGQARVCDWRMVELKEGE